MLPKLISHDQTGFIKDRFIGENLRLVDSVIKYTAAKDIPGLLLFLDFEKAFDSLEWPFIHKTLEHFGFGPTLIKWVKVFYCNIESCILNNGWSSNFFKLSRGVRQGTWIKKYLDINNCGNWKTFIDLELQHYGGDVLLRGNLNKKDNSCLTTISCPFVKEILEIWSEVFFEAKVSSEDHLLSLPLWYNSLIRIGNRPVFYKDWYAEGVTKVEHLWDNSTSFLTWTDFQNKYNLKIRFLDYFGIVSAIKSLHKNEVYHKYECMFTKFLECAKPNRLVYKKLISFKSAQPHSSQEKWSNDLNLPQDEKIDWSAAYQLAFQCTKSSKLITFNCKFLHRRLATNNFLKKIGVVESENALFANPKQTMEV